MIFTNPWGFLALLSIPAIIGLHFFHSQKLSRRIGGLHLWSFAKVRMPVGGRFNRLLRSFSLLLQILTALLLSMLIAGADIPTESSARHYTVILDDSISMNAGLNKSAAERVRELTGKWPGKHDKYTLIAAGYMPSVIAGPFADHYEFINTMDSWSPEDRTCDLEAALNLAGKFVGDGKMLFLTDDEALGRAYGETIEIGATGEALENAAIDYADRVRIKPDTDRIVVTIQAYSHGDIYTKLNAEINGQVIFSRKIGLSPLKAVYLAFETGEIDKPLTLYISDDALQNDNTATLSPVTIKTVRIGISGLDEIAEQLSRAIASVPYIVTADDPASADLVFAKNGSYLPSGNNRLVCYISDPEANHEIKGVDGRDIVIDKNARLTENLALDGVLWGYHIERNQDGVILPAFTNNARSFITHNGYPLLWRELTIRYTNIPFQKKQIIYHLNLLWDRTNIFKDPAWPVLVYGIIEECRDAIPGLSRTNLRLGETVELNLEPKSDQPEEFILKRNGGKFQTFDELPELLPELPVGSYEIVEGDTAALAAFNINLFAPGESDLRAMSARKPDLDSLITQSVRKAEKNMVFFYTFLLMIIIFTALSWISQDLSR